MGVHCGDSLGATLEFKPWSEIRRQYPNGLREIVGGGILNWPVGAATDDTDLTRAVLLAYRDFEEKKEQERTGSSKQPVEDSGSSSDINIAKAAAEYALLWNEGDWPGRKKGSRPIDIGNATRTGLGRYKRLRDPSKCGAGIGSAGNGSLMRCIPTGLFAPNAARRRSESLAISVFTHDDPRCTVACAAYNEMVAALVDGKTPQAAVESGKVVADELSNADVLSAIREGETLPLAKTAGEGPPITASGYVLASLKLAVAAVLDARSFEDVLADVVRIGGDTDTNGAIAGGLLGARDGIENIPERWLEKLQFRREFEEVAMRILQLQRVHGG